MALGLGEQLAQACALAPFYGAPRNVQASFKYAF